jgi:hypothetical protein
MESRLYRVAVQRHTYGPDENNPYRNLSASSVPHNQCRRELEVTYGRDCSTWVARLRVAQAQRLLIRSLWREKLCDNAALRIIANESVIMPQVQDADECFSR